VRDENRAGRLGAQLKGSARKNACGFGRNRETASGVRADRGVETFAIDRRMKRSGARLQGRAPAIACSPEQRHAASAPPPDQRGHPVGNDRKNAGVRAETGSERIVAGSTEVESWPSRAANRVRRLCPMNRRRAGNRSQISRTTGGRRWKLGSSNRWKRIVRLPFGARNNPRPRYSSSRPSVSR
jgi:hypothetical protein